MKNQNAVMVLLHTREGYPVLPRTISQFSCEIVSCRLILRSKEKKLGRPGAWVGQGYQPVIKAR